jgi:hypothetical protein
VFRVTQYAVPNDTFFTTSGSAPTFAQSYFSLDQLDQYVSLTNVFDQYRIDMVELWMSPNGNTGTGTTGDVTTVIDYDDATSLPSYTAGLDYPNATLTNPNTGVYRRFVPRIATAAYNGSFGGYANASPQWIDATSPNVQHYGFKCCSDIASGATTFTLRWRLHVSFRQVR